MNTWMPCQICHGPWESSRIPDAWRETAKATCVTRWFFVSMEAPGTCMNCIWTVYELSCCTTCMVPLGGHVPSSISLASADQQASSKPDSLRWLRSWRHSYSADCNSLKRLPSRQWEAKKIRKVMDFTVMIQCILEIEDYYGMLWVLRGSRVGQLQLRSGISASSPRTAKHIVLPVSGEMVSQVWEDSTKTWVEISSLI